MIESIKELWDNRKNPQGRIDITIFFINIFLILTHLVLMVVYSIVGHYFMISINILSLIFYICWFIGCYKHKNLYITLVFMEIWVHMLIGIIAFGWHASFQNWIFALIVGTFLPSYKEDVYKPEYKRAFIYTSIIVLSYFIFAVLIYVIDFHIYIQISDVMLRFLFTFNNMISFLAIILFAIFYTTRNESRVHELIKKAEYDELTSLYNRHALQQVGSSIKAEALNHKDYYSVAILDIDFFKKINDTYGHSSGDLVLKELANLIRAYSLKGIAPGRWGGEEFVMIAPHTIDYGEFIIILEKLREKVEKTEFIIEGKDKIHLTISIGSYNVKGTVCLDDAISKADKRLYDAKDSGRNKLIS